MPAKLDDVQVDALADAVAYLIDLARKRREERGTIEDGSREDDSAPGAEAITQIDRRVDSTATRKVRQIG